MQFSASLTKVVVLAMASLSMAEDPPNACVYSQSKKDAACVPGAGDLFCTGTHFHTICEPGMFPAFDLGAIKKNDNRATGWQEVGTGYRLSAAYQLAPREWASQRQLSEDAHWYPDSVRHLNISRPIVEKSTRACSLALTGARTSPRSLPRSQDEDEDEDEDEDIPPALDPSHFSVWLAGRGSTGTDSASAAFAADMRASPKAHYS
ncbi:unnamed protein product [Diplocarpon coronariae]